MSTLVDPLQVLSQMPPGSALYSREIISDRWEVAWLIREDTTRIKNLGDNSEVEFRAGIIWENSVALIPVLVRIGPGTHENIYETWINVHQPEDGFRYLRDLSTQDKIIIHLYGDGCKLERSLKVSNQLHKFIIEIMDLVKDTPLIVLDDGNALDLQSWVMLGYIVVRANKKEHALLNRVFDNFNAMMGK